MIKKFLVEFATWFWDSFLYALQQVIYWLTKLLYYIVHAITTVLSSVLDVLPDSFLFPAVDLQWLSDPHPGIVNTIASAMCWVFPFDFFIIGLSVLSTALLLYLSTSWFLRWLKVIK